MSAFISEKMHPLQPLPRAHEAATPFVTSNLPDVEARNLETNNEKQVTWVDKKTQEVLGYGACWFPGLPSRPPGNNPNANSWTAKALFHADHAVAPVPRLVVTFKSYEPTAMDAAMDLVADAANAIEGCYLVSRERKKRDKKYFALNRSPFAVGAKKDKFVIILQKGMVKIVATDNARFEALVYVLKHQQYRSTRVKLELSYSSRLPIEMIADEK